jgi:hypothetical protein
MEQTLVMRLKELHDSVMESTTRSPIDFLGAQLGAVWVALEAFAVEIDRINEVH